MIMNRAVTITAMLGGILCIILSFAFGSAFFAFVAAVLFLAGFSLWKYGYLLVPMLTKASNVIEIRGPYEVASTRDYIIRRSGDGYYATKFMEVKFYESSMDKDEGGKKYLFEAFEKTIGSLKFMTKISMMISPVNLTTHIEDIKTKRGAAESKRAKLQKSSEEAVKLDREISMWNRLLDKITTGERPVEILAYASTTAYGITREEAVSKAKRQAKEVKTALSSTLGCDVTELYDLDMIRCYEWEFFPPASEEDMKDEVF